MRCFVMNQKEMHNLGDAEMNQVLINVIAFYDVDFKMQRWRSMCDLKEEFQNITSDIEFGKKTANAWRDYMSDAENQRAKLTGATTGIHMTTNHDSQQEAMQAIPTPTIVHRGDHEVKHIEGQASGSSYTAKQYRDWNDSGWW